MQDLKKKSNLFCFFLFSEFSQKIPVVFILEKIYILEAAIIFIFFYQKFFPPIAHYYRVFCEMKNNVSFNLELIKMISKRIN